MEQHSSVGDMTDSQWLSFDEFHHLSMMELVKDISEVLANWTLKPNGLSNP